MAKAMIIRLGKYFNVKKNKFKPDMNVKKRKVSIAHTGARKHYQEPILLEQWGVLDTFYTDFYFKNKFIRALLNRRSINRKLPAWSSRMIGRHDSLLDNAKVIDFPLFGIINAYKRTSTNGSKLFTENFCDISKQFCELVLKTGIDECDTFYGFNCTSLEIFEYAKSNKIKCILDQVIAESSLRVSLMLEEEERWQGWSKLPFLKSKCHDLRTEREAKEHQLADHIICGSKFVKQSLIQSGIASNKISVVSLGKLFQTSPQQCIEKGGNLQQINILFAGEVGLRKGVPYLLDALKFLKLETDIPFNCKIAGDINLNSEKLSAYQDVCEFLGKVPRNEMQQLYQWANVFIIPSICEGSAMVIYEAMINNVPVITTPNSGSLIRNGIDGYVVPIRDSRAIMNRITDVYKGKLDNFSTSDNSQYLADCFHESEEILRDLLTTW